MSQSVSNGGESNPPHNAKVVPIRADLGSGTSLSTRSAADLAAEFLAKARQRFLTSAKLPSKPMGQYNYRTWIRFMRLTGGLNDYELGVADTLELQTGFPTVRQRGVLWRAMKRIFPAGCSKWGQP